MKNRKKELDVLCLGIFVADTLAKPIERMPQWRQLALVDHVELAVGGCANNTATALARLGLRVGAVGRVGCDGFGDFVLRQLETEKIDVRGMHRDKKTNTSFTFVMIVPVARVTAPDTPVPFAPVMERYYLPDAAKIVRAVKQLL